LATLSFTVTSIDCENFLNSLASLTQIPLANWCLARTASGISSNDLIIGILDSQTFTADQAATQLGNLGTNQLATIDVSAVSIEKVPGAASSMAISLSLLGSLVLTLWALF